MANFLNIFSKLFTCVLQYCGDQDDKQWLYENHKMPATGGKAYMMLLEDVKDLAEDDEYRWVLSFLESHYIY